MATDMGREKMGTSPSPALTKLNFRRTDAPRRLARNRRCKASGASVGLMRLCSLAAGSHIDSSREIPSACLKAKICLSGTLLLCMHTYIRCRHMGSVREREGESERLRRVEREIYPSNELCTNVDGLQSEAYRRAALWQPRLQLTNNGRLTATWRASLRKAAERPAAPPGAGTLWLGRGRSWPCPAYPRAEKAPLES